MDRPARTSTMHGMPRQVAQPRTPYAFVLGQIGGEIVRGAIPENSILPGDGELTKRFKVSRTVLREAFKTLSAKGMIQARAGVGTRVLARRFWNLLDTDILRWQVESGAGSDFLCSLSEMRLALEPEAAALAAERRSEDQLQALQGFVDRMEGSRFSPDDFVEGDLRFHLTVAEASGNPFMRSISALVEAALAITFAISSPLPDAALHEVTVARHRAIADAISRRDADSARSAMCAVIREGMKRVARVEEPNQDRAASAPTRASSERNVT